MVDWVPKTRLGHMVLNGEVTTMSEALATKLPLREPEIVDILLPDLQDEVIDLNMVQRMTDSGRRVRFAVTCIVGNGDGFIGVGRAKGKEVGPTRMPLSPMDPKNVERLKAAMKAYGIL
jgi:small subunit ribosomal protein S5